MNDFNSLLPHHRLLAYQGACELLDAVQRARVLAAELRRFSA
ncbi:MAG TPA: hypothetical protein VGP93_00690 [Polyangiaceae bacterium]|jgi:hypothetical protein|nr:hypothetical protein [Polyangiaceae bacterium]